MARPDNPLILQSDRTVLLEAHHERYEAARDAIAPFAELVKSPEHIHTYRITPLSLWNAASAGHGAEQILATLDEYAKYPVPANVARDVRDFIGRFGRLQIQRGHDGGLVLRSIDPALLREVAGLKTVAPLLGGMEPTGDALQVPLLNRGLLKQALLKHGYPVEDRGGFTEGAPLDVALREVTLAGQPLALRPYQIEAVEVFLAGGGVQGGHGVIVLPCGAGKTLVGMATLAALKKQTLILVTNVTSARQWRSELLDKTTLTADQIGEYHGRTKQVRPVTLATYQILTMRRGQVYPHFDLLTGADWGLIVYDEVHMLPAPVFRITAEIQARRRLGLTATLVREDNKEGDVFALIGPKRYDVPWKQMEQQGYVAEAACYELRLPLTPDRRLAYALAEERDRFRIASENPLKLPVATELCENHRQDSVLVIGVYLDQLHELAQALGAPLITGETPQGQREHLLGQFRHGELKRLVVSKVANFSIDLPDANVCVQVSGSFGSRQEEAQRLGRILRPKAGGGKATFYTLVTKDSVEQEFAMNRQLFLTEQGYRYYIEDWTPPPPPEEVDSQVTAGPALLPAPGETAHAAPAAGDG